MTDKELRHMSKGDLLEIIARYQEREQVQLQEIQQLKQQLEDRRIQIENAGSIADATLHIHHVFEAAQAAADQFVEEVRAANADKEAQGRRIIEAAQAEAEAVRLQTQEDCRAMTETAKQECDAMYDQITKLLKSYEELRSLLPGKVTSR